MVYEFVRVNKDMDLSKYQIDGFFFFIIIQSFTDAWPLLIDDFIGFIKNNN